MHVRVGVIYDNRKKAFDVITDKKLIRVPAVTDAEDGSGYRRESDSPRHERYFLSDYHTDTSKKVFLGSDYINSEDVENVAYQIEVIRLDMEKLNEVIEKVREDFPDAKPCVFFSNRSL